MVQQHSTRSRLDSTFPNKNHFVNALEWRCYKTLTDVKQTIKKPDQLWQLYLKTQLLWTHLQGIAHHLRERHDSKIIPFSHDLQVTKEQTAEIERSSRRLCKRP